MHRRTYLAGAGTALGAAAGCTALLGVTACEPGADRMGDVDGSRPVEGGGRTYSVRGTVVGFPGDAMLLDDGTGKVRLAPGESRRRFDADLGPVGACASADGTLSAALVRRHGMAALVVDRADLDVVAESTSDASPVATPPSPELAVGYPSDGAVRLTAVQPDDAAAGNVFLASGERARPWPTLDDETAAGDPLREGASVTLREVPGRWVAVQWRSPDRTWGHGVGRFRVRRG